MCPRNALAALITCTTASVVVAQSSVPPNYGTYVLDPLYQENPATGWAEQRIEEKLDRAMVAVRSGENAIYLGWRLLKSDPDDVAFNVYRSTAGGEVIKLNREPHRKTTDFVDRGAPLDRQNTWSIRPVLNGKEADVCGQVTLPPDPPRRQYVSFKLRDDVSSRSVDKIGIGDLDGDGAYDFVIKRPRGAVDPGRRRPSRDTFKLEAYRSDGTFMWRRDLGWAIQLGIWYSPMVVYDLDGDGRAEIAVKTGEGDPRDESGQVLTGPEFCSIWNGQTGEEITRVDWIPRGEPADWGDTTGNRMNRNMLGVAYLDGKTPSLLVVRGIYGLMKVDAWFLHNKQLHKAWSWTNARAGWKYQGQGSHNIHVADIDGDGRDELLNGSIAIDHDGRTLWSTGLGHADRFFVTDVDPDRPGLEVWYGVEDPHPQNGVSLWDARTGALIFGTREPTGDDQVDRALTADIDPDHPGMECWGNKFFYSSQGEDLGPDVPPLGGLVWWDGDALRELEHRGTVSKWRGPVLTRGIEGSVLAWADILGDWREEIITVARGEIRIYTTVIPATDRRMCLMQDPLYRLDVALVAQGYAQPPMTTINLAPHPAERIRK